MRHLVEIILVFISLLSCQSNLTKVVNIDEASIEWPRKGISNVKNETSHDITLITSFPNQTTKSIQTNIRAGEVAQFDIGDSSPGLSIDECSTAVIKFPNGNVVFCDKKGIDPWSRYFFDTFNEREEYELVDINGKLINHKLIIKSYHIDEKLLSMWREAHPSEIGDWAPIELNIPSANFPYEGGEETIIALNYPSWWINCGYEDAYTDDDGEIVYVNIVYANSSDGKGSYTYDLIDGGWYYAYVPNKGKSNSLVIITDENTTGGPRHASILMQAGDSFGTVTISQDSN